MVACRASGFALIEVLVAALVLAIGMVGVMASQLAAQRARHGTALMSAAVQLASSVAERMRANGGARHHYIGLDYDALRDGPPSAAVAACFVAPCSKSELAGFDLSDIRHVVYQRFPGGRVVVCRDLAVAQPGARVGWPCTGGPTAPVAVKIGWIERSAHVPQAESRPALAMLLATGAP